MRKIILVFMVTLTLGAFAESPHEMLADHFGTYRLNSNITPGRSEYFLLKIFPKGDTTIAITSQNGAVGPVSWFRLDLEEKDTAYSGACDEVPCWKERSYWTQSENTLVKTFEWNLEKTIKWPSGRLETRTEKMVVFNYEKHTGLLRATRFDLRRKRRWDPDVERWNAQLWKKKASL